ncbi:hypothetical protein ACFV4T_14790, partial [Streptomyces sp. NPDC059755]
MPTTAPQDPSQPWTRKAFLRGMTAVGLAPLLPAAAHAASAATRPGFDLVRDGVAVDVFVDAADDPAVIRAAGDLRADVERVCGVRPGLRHTLPERSTALVLVGTLGGGGGGGRGGGPGRRGRRAGLGGGVGAVTPVGGRPAPRRG